HTYACKYTQDDPPDGPKCENKSAFYGSLLASGLMSTRLCISCRFFSHAPSFSFSFSLLTVPANIILLTIALMLLGTFIGLTGMRFFVFSASGNATKRCNA